MSEFSTYHFENERRVHGYLLILLGVVRLDGLGLDYYCRVATGERTALGGDSACHIARGQSECHGDSSSDGHHQILDGLPKAFFLNIG